MSKYLNLSIKEIHELLISKKIKPIDLVEEAFEVLDNNKAYEMFKTWISNQGGDLSKLKISDKVILIKSNQDGIISHINALKVGELSVKLGAGRITKDSKIDYSVGITLLKQSGDLVKKGDILAKLYVNDLNIKNFFILVYFHKKKWYYKLNGCGISKDSFPIFIFV